jgi:hypothetical protein
MARRDREQEGRAQGDSAKSGHHLATPFSAQVTFSAGGIVHVPSRIEGLFSFGQYVRSISRNLPAGAGSQFDSLSARHDEQYVGAPFGGTTRGGHHGVDCEASSL